jgi:hypothetical protein
MIDITTNDDPIIPREVWRPIIWSFFLQLAQEYPETYNIVAIQRDDPEMFHRIAEQDEALERLGDARRSEIESTYRRLLVRERHPHPLDCFILLALHDPSFLRDTEATLRDTEATASHTPGSTRKLPW